MKRAFSLTALLAAFAVSPLGAQPFGKSENLAPNVPTPQAVVDRMLEAARIKPGETVYDLGSGDGRILITAASKFGARAVGVELDPEIYRTSLLRIRALGLEDKVRVIHSSALRVDLSPADVVTMCLLTISNERLRPNLEKYLKPGARVVTNEFPIKGWKPAEMVEIRVSGMNHHIFVYEIGRK